MLVAGDMTSGDSVHSFLWQADSDCEHRLLSFSSLSRLAWLQAARGKFFSNRVGDWRSACHSMVTQSCLFCMQQCIELHVSCTKRALDM